MTIAAVVGRGFGPDASIAGVVTRGFSIGVVIAQPPNASLTTRGYGENGTIGGIVTRFYNIGSAVAEKPNTGGTASLYRYLHLQRHRHHLYTEKLKAASERVETEIKRAEKVKRPEVKALAKRGRKVLKRVETAVEAEDNLRTLFDLENAIMSAVDARIRSEALRHAAQADMYIRELNDHIALLDAEDDEILAILLS